MVAQATGAAPQVVNVHQNMKVCPGLVKYPAPWLQENTDLGIIHASLPGETSTKVEDLENKTIFGIILSVKHGQGSKFKSYERSNFSQFSQSIAAKRQRVMQTSPYDRLLICGDLTAKDGSCFALVFAKPENSKASLRWASHTFGVGTLFYLGEPEKIDSMLGSSMPIIRTSWAIVPLSISESQSMASLASPTSFGIPSGSGDHKFFLFHNQSIEVVAFRLRHDTVSCKGKFCDRAKVLDTQVSCGCLQVGQERHPLVGEFSVKLNFPGLDYATSAGTEEVVPNFRSLRTTQYFFDNLEDYSSLEPSVIDGNTNKNRKQIREMVKKVNDSDGWSVCGWFRRGDVQDASNQDQKVDSDSVTLHLSMLVPTKPSLAHLKEASYNSIMIKKTAAL